MADGLMCRKVNHPWVELPDEEVPGDIFAGTTLIKIGWGCSQCGSIRVELYRRNGVLDDRRYRYPDSYKELGKELKESQRANETRGQTVNRRFLMERGLIREPARFAQKRRERTSR